MRKLFKIFSKEKRTENPGNIQVVGTLRIPNRYKEGLESVGDQLNIYISNSGGIFYLIGDPDTDDRYSSRYVVRNFDQKKTLFGASWEWKRQ